MDTMDWRVVADAGMAFVGSLLPKRPQACFWVFVVAAASTWYTSSTGKQMDLVDGVCGHEHRETFALTLSQKKT